MSGEWCAHCGSGMVLNGSKQVHYKDLVNGAGGEREARIQRMACRSCRATRYQGLPDLVPGLRERGAQHRADPAGGDHADRES